MEVLCCGAGDKPTGGSGTTVEGAELLPLTGPASAHTQGPAALFSHGTLLEVFPTL